MQANTVLMIRPASFGFNVETSATNSFQQKSLTESVNEKAQKEFDAFVVLLRENGIEVIVVGDTLEPIKPDAVFPNNWFSTHRDGKLLLYPMLNKSRNAERREDIISLLAKIFNYSIQDFSGDGSRNQIFEGTGSFVFDHESKVAYIAESPRTHISLGREISEMLGYEPVTFGTNYKNSGPVYHTNVVMCVGDKFAVVCLDVITEKELVKERLRNSGKKIIEISVEEMEHFAGNMLLLENSALEKILVMSDSAFRFLEKGKLKELEQYAVIIHPAIPTIEKIGGGSVRCMMAEIFSKSRS